MINLKHYGYTNTAEAPPSGLLPARITEVQRDLYTAITPHGEVHAVLKGAFMHNALMREDFPCVGDFVLLDYNESGDSRIVRLLPRRTKFSRADFSGHKVGYAKTIHEQLVAANFDYVFIVTSLNHDFRISRVVRYLTQARQSGGAPVVILTKADLCEKYETHVQEVRDAVQNVPVHAISSHTGLGLSALGEYLQPAKTVVFLGMSGVGKSSLLNALMAQEVMAVKDIREDDSRGRHTTTHRQLFVLPCGAMVIDTPGMRELGLLNAEEAISAGFTDVEDLFSQCKFNNCRHESEPGCAVREALENGTLAQKQWAQYQAQMRENKYVDDKAGYMRDRRAEDKALTMWGKEKKKRGGFKVDRF
ncbi:MAG: ribosome small subunit-dependent GTPase A [Defluviitaleaceae bacterium]|nr:ribosome small subunit-dependent GTPase A [Defluviitaleaceae bacterium]MCL2275797.1 ribosome small subunit-dependent GTPase A [Defluviitaleaceae bacterium]